MNTCEHSFETLKEEETSESGMFGGIKKKRTYTLKCKKCGEITFRSVPRA